MQHSFDIDIATTYGLNEAIILNNIYFWVRHNEANNENFYDGYYWTYNSVSAFRELFPYLTERQISNAINNLVTQGILIKGNYNKNKFDRTTWYAITEQGKCILQNCSIDYAKMSNRDNKNVEPIPYINKDTKQDTRKEREKKRFSPPTKDDCTAYYLENNFSFDLDYFYKYYTELNWHTANGRKIQNWKNQMRTWQLKETSSPQSLFSKKSNAYKETVPQTQKTDEDLLSEWYFELYEDLFPKDRPNWYEWLETHTIEDYRKEHKNA